MSKHYSKLLDEAGFTSNVLSLEELPDNFIFNDSYGSRSKDMEIIVATYIQAVDQFIFVIPEYNGGFPGVLKAFIDCLDPSDLHHKKAALVGLSSGHAGGARAMDQFTNVLNYLKVNVNYCKPKFSGIDGIIDSKEEEHEISSKLHVQMEALQAFFKKD